MQQEFVRKEYTYMTHRARLLWVFRWWGACWLLGKCLSQWTSVEWWSGERCRHHNYKKCALFVRLLWSAPLRGPSLRPLGTLACARPSRAKRGGDRGRRTGSMTFVASVRTRRNVHQSVAPRARLYVTIRKRKEEPAIRKKQVFFLWPVVREQERAFRSEHSQQPRRRTMMHLYCVQHARLANTRSDRIVDVFDAEKYVSTRRNAAWKKNTTTQKKHITILYTIVKYIIPSIEQYRCTNADWSFLVAGILPQDCQMNVWALCMDCWCVWYDPENDQ